MGVDDQAIKPPMDVLFRENAVDVSHNKHMNPESGLFAAADRDADYGDGPDLIEMLVGRGNAFTTTNRQPAAQVNQAPQQNQTLNVAKLEAAVNTQHQKPLEADKALANNKSPAGVQQDINKAAAPAAEAKMEMAKVPAEMLNPRGANAGGPSNTVGAGVAAGIASVAADMVVPGAGAIVGAMAGLGSLATATQKTEGYFSSAIETRGGDSAPAYRPAPTPDVTMSAPGGQMLNLEIEGKPHLNPGDVEITESSLAGLKIGGRSLTEAAQAIDKLGTSCQAAQEGLERWMALRGIDLEKNGVTPGGEPGLSQFKPDQHFAKGLDRDNASLAAPVMRMA